MSCPFQFSGIPYYQERESRKYNALLKANAEFIKLNCPGGFNLACDGIDTSIYVDEWKGTKFLTEVCRIQFDY